jgi:hypothetical protein
MNLKVTALALGFAVVSAVVPHTVAHAEFTRPFHNHVYVWPDIGTPAYSAGCELRQWWEDGSALAYCPEDGETYLYDPDGQPVPNVPDNPVRAPGWYVAPEIYQIGPGA